MDPNDKELQEVGLKNGVDIRLRCQPPSSLDLNVLDFGSVALSKPYNIRYVLETLKKKLVPSE